MTRRRRRGEPRGRVPRELHHAYGARARTLGHAVLSLLPPPAPAPPGTPCSACRGRGGAVGCLACRRWGHLLRDGDPVAYRNLVNRAICAVAPAGPAAPPPPRYTPGNAGHSQAKLVREMIKSMMAVGACTTTNVLSSGCRAGDQTTSVTELVSSSSWDILLHRCYLGHNTEMSPNISGGRVNNSSVAFSSPDTSTSKSDNPKGSGSCGSAKFTEPNCSIEGCNRSELPLTNGSIKCSSLDNQNPRKRKRLYSWQRHNKQKQICSEDRLSTGWSKINIIVDNDSLAMSSDMTHSHTKEPHGVLSNENSPSSVFDIDIRSSQCNSTSRIQSTFPQVGLPNFMHLNN